MYKVSVVVPVYNVESYLKRCLDSLLNQTLSDIEIICVNDCSSDGSIQILKEYKSHNSNIVIYNNKNNLGLGSTRDEGIKRAQADFIMFVDSDDYVDVDWVENYYNVISNSDYDIVMGGYTIQGSQSSRVVKVTDNKFTLFFYSTVCNKIYRKSFIVDNNLNFAGLRRSEDEYWKIHQALSNPKYRVIDDTGYYYWQNEKSITHSSENNKDIEKKLSELLNTIYNSIDFDGLSKYQIDMVEYLFISDVIIWNFLYDRGLNYKEIRRRVDVGFEELKRFFPDFKNNPYIKFGKIHGDNKLADLLVSVEMFLYKIGLKRIVFYLGSFLSSKEKV